MFGGVASVLKKLLTFEVSPPPPPPPPPPGLLELKYFAVIPTFSICMTRSNYPGAESLGRFSSSERERKLPRLEFMFSITLSISLFLVIVF